MATRQKDKSSSKPRQRNRKAERPSEKLDQVQSPKLDPEIEEPIVPEIAATEAVAIDEAAAAEFVPSEISVPVEPASTPEVAPPEVTPPEVTRAISPPMELAPAAMVSAATTDHASVGLQGIANAYRNYANTSLEQTGSFVEKLMSVRSFDKAAEVQIEFARQAYANLIAESQNIYQLYSRLTGQIFKSWQGFSVSARTK
jgi:Phasin protein